MLFLPTTRAILSIDRRRHHARGTHHRRLTTTITRRHPRLVVRRRLTPIRLPAADVEATTAVVEDITDPTGRMQLRKEEQKSIILMMARGILFHLPDLNRLS